MIKANVLFVCVDNSFLSLAAEAYFNQTALGGLRAFSGGPMPRDEMVSLTKKGSFCPWNGGGGASSQILVDFCSPTSTSTGLHSKPSEKCASRQATSMARQSDEDELGHLAR